MNRFSLSMIILTLVTITTFFSVKPVQAQSYPSGVKFYTWRQGEGSVVMTEAAYTACFLQKISGKFEGGGEAVWIRLENNRWILGGKSKQQDVQAKAMCVPLDLVQRHAQYPKTVITSSVEVKSCKTDWTSIIPSACSVPTIREIKLGNIEASPSTFCYLTEISGNLNGHHEYARISKYDLTGTAYKHGNDLISVLSVASNAGKVKASAGCIFNPRNDPFQVLPSESQMFFWRQGQAPIHLPDTDKAFCVLNYVAGRFEGGGETVEIYSRGDNSQWLGGASQQEHVSAGARCLPYNTTTQIPQKPNQPLPPIRVRNGQIVNGSNLCLDVHSPDFTKTGARVQLWECHSGQHQQWKLPPDGEFGQIVSPSGLCLDAAGSSGHRNGTPIHMWPCHNAANQQWRVEGNRIINGTGYCLDAHSNDMESNGARIQLWECNGWLNQNWSIE